MQRLQHQARQPHGVFGPLGVAADPKQALGSPAADAAVRVAQVIGGQWLGQHRGLVDRATGDDPGVHAGAAMLHAQPRVVAGAHSVAGLAGHTRQRTGQHTPTASTIGQGKHAQHGGAWLQVAVHTALDGALHRVLQVALHRAALPHRRLARPHALQQGVARRIGVNACAECGALGEPQVGHHGGAKGAVRKGRRHHKIRQPLAQGLPDAGFTAPPTGRCRQQQALP